MSRLSSDAIKDIECVEKEVPLFFSVAHLKNGFIAEFIADFSTAEDKVHDISSDSRTLVMDCNVKKWSNGEVTHDGLEVKVHFPLKTFSRRLFHRYGISLINNDNKYLIRLRKKPSKGKNYSFDILNCEEVKNE